MLNVQLKLNVVEAMGAEMQIWLYLYLVIRDVMIQTAGDNKSNETGRDVLDYELKTCEISESNMRQMLNGVCFGRLIIALRKSVVGKFPLQLQQVFILDP